MKRLLFHLLLLSLAIVAVSCSKDSQSGAIRSIDDLGGKKVAVMTGSVMEIYATDVLTNSEIVRLNSNVDAVVAVSTGSAHACLASSLEWPLIQVANPDLYAVTDTIRPVPVSFAFHKDNAELRDRFNAFASSYLESDEFRQMRAEWSTPGNTRQVPDYSAENLPNGVLRVVAHASSEPFCFMKNGRMSGIEPEILIEFARTLGKTVEFTDNDFSSLIPHLSAGRADVACCLICITPEREKIVNFGIPWICEAQVLVAKNNSYSASTGSFMENVKNGLKKNLITEDRYLMLLDGLKMTVFISLLSAVLGTILGVIMCMGLMSRRKSVSNPTGAVVEFLRCMPQVVLLLIMFYLVFGKSDVSGSLVATVTFSLCFGAYTSVIFKSACQSVDKGQTEAALAMGFSPFRSFREFVLPQVITYALPVYKGEFIGLIKATSIVGYIAVADLTRAGDIIRSRTFEAFFPLILVTVAYFVIIWLLTLLIRIVEVKNRPVRNRYSSDTNK